MSSISLKFRQCFGFAPIFLVPQCTNLIYSSYHQKDQLLSSIRKQYASQFIISSIYLMNWAGISHAVTFWKLIFLWSYIMVMNWPSDSWMWVYNYKAPHLPSFFTLSDLPVKGSFRDTGQCFASTRYEISEFPSQGSVVLRMSKTCNFLIPHCQKLWSLCLKQSRPTSLISQSSWWRS